MQSTKHKLKDKVEKTEVDLLKEKIQQLEALISNSTSIIGYTSVANSGKNFISSKIFLLLLHNL